MESELTTLKRSNAQLRDTVEEAVANEKQVHTAKLNEVGHKNEMQVRGLKEALSEANKNIEQLKSMHNDKRRLVEDLQQQLAAAHSGVQAHASELDYHRSSYESAKNALTTELEHHKAGHEHHRSEAARILQAHTKFAREAKLAHEAVVAELEKTRAAHRDVHEDFQISQSEVKNHMAAYATLKEEHDRMVTHLKAVEHAAKENASQATASHSETMPISELIELEREQYQGVMKEHSALLTKYDALRTEYEDLQDAHSKEKASHSNSVSLLSTLRGYYHDMEEYSMALESELEEKGVTDLATVVKKPKPHIHHHPHHEQSVHGAIADTLGEFGLQDDYLKQTRHYSHSKNRHGKHSAHDGGQDHHHHHHHHHHHGDKTKVKGDASSGAKTFSHSPSRRRTSSTNSSSSSHSENNAQRNEEIRSIEEGTTEISSAVERCKELEATVRSLEAQLDSTKAQALADHAQDTQMLAEMKAQFDSLMISYSQQEKEEEQFKQVASAESEHAKDVEKENEVITGIINEETAILADMEKKLEDYEDQIVSMSAKIKAQSKEIEALKKNETPSTAAVSTAMEIEEQAALRLELRQTVEELALTKKALEEMQAGQQHQPPLLLRSTPKAEDEALTVTDLSLGEAKEQKSESYNDEPATVRAFESLSKGIIDSLVENEVLSAPAAAELMSEATNTEQPCVILSSRAQTKVSKALKPFTDGHKEWLKSVAVVESLQEELHVVKKQLSDAVEGADYAVSDPKRRQSHHTSSAYDDSETIEGSTPASKASSKVASVVRAGELEQSRSEAQLVLELTKLEGDARVKTLIGKIKDMKKSTAAAIERVKQEKIEALNVLQSKHEARVEMLTDEIDSLKKTVNQQAESLAEQSMARSSTLDSKLQIERAKRKDLIKEFEKIDQEHRVTIEELEISTYSSSNVAKEPSFK